MRLGGRLELTGWFDDAALRSKALKQRTVFGCKCVAQTALISPLVAWLRAILRGLLAWVLRSKLVRFHLSLVHRQAARIRPCGEISVPDIDAMGAHRPPPPKRHKAVDENGELTGQS